MKTLTLKNIFNLSFFLSEKLDSTAPAPAKKRPSMWQNIVDMEEYKKRFWLKNTKKERTLIINLFSRCLKEELGYIGVAIMHLAHNEIKEQEKNEYCALCVHRTMLKRIIKFGHELMAENVPNHCAPDYETYKNLNGYDLLNVLQETKIDYAILAFGVLNYFQCQKIDFKNYTLLQMALELCLEHKKESIYEQVCWPKLPKVTIPLEEIKNNAINEKFMEIDAKGIKGIIRYAEDLEQIDLEAFQKTYGSRHILTFEDGKSIGIVTLKPNNQPWKNFIGLRAEDIKIIEE